MVERNLMSVAMALAGAAMLASFGANARDLMVVGFGGPFQDNARTALFQGYAKATNQTVKKSPRNQTPNSMPAKGCTKLKTAN